MPAAEAADAAGPSNEFERALTADEVASVQSALGQLFSTKVAPDGFMAMPRPVSPNSVPTSLKW